MNASTAGLSSSSDVWGAPSDVAVIAILKAGATFSVIGASSEICFDYTHLIVSVDPAYPPSRQIIYLKVAEPCALVVLKGTGIINPVVRNFIATEAHIRVEVPALELLADGSILGGNETTAPSSNTDVLSPHQHIADVDSDIPLGPDSVGTLSFTSGNTGIPKGVHGQHYSLTHFFPWMGERFNLGSHSRFTMLSEITHDPIQRDSMLGFTVILQTMLTLQISVHPIVLWDTVVRPNGRRHWHIWTTS
jgi:L-aminoadipate-semialdehyde dehydrogenase